VEKINLGDYMTVAEARDAIGASPRGIWRAISRAGRDKVCIRFLDRTLVRRSALEVLKQHFYPYGSDAHQGMVREWGRRGGTAKAKTAKKQIAKTKRRPRS
jgi:hypothetical protein